VWESDIGGIVCTAHRRRYALSQHSSVTVYNADNCMTGLEGVVVTEECANLWFMNRTFTWLYSLLLSFMGKIVMGECTE
jgi:hypothetical protein